MAPVDGLREGGGWRGQQGSRRSLSWASCEGRGRILAVRVQLGGHSAAPRMAYWPKAGSEVKVSRKDADHGRLLEHLNLASNPLSHGHLSE